VEPVSLFILFKQEKPMALMFQRIARNYTRNGYFPTDTETTARVLNYLQPCKTGSMYLIDPCAGEGVALAECKQHLHQPELNRTVETFAVEYNAERAQQAKQLLDRCLHGDFQDTVITPRSFGLLWLNPPYGDLVSDKAQTGSQNTCKGKKRLEKLFYRQSNRLLQYSGVLVLIVPHYTLDNEFRRWLAAGFDHIQVFLAPEQQFQQAVVLATRRRTQAHDEDYRTGLQVLEQFCAMDLQDKPILPATVSETDCYSIPAATVKDIRFNALNIDPVQFQQEITRYPCLWQQFGHQLNTVGKVHRRPLMALSDWHLALALAAGQVSGVVRSNDGKKTFVIKGDTFKDKKQTVQREAQADSAIRETRVSLDVFIPQIKAIDMTPESPTFGEIFTIK
jgi:tRNA1(Val) A37 N6-methylase TrmN6